MAAKNFIEIGTKFTGNPKELVKNLSGPLAKAGKAAREASLSYDKFSQSLSKDAEEFEKARVGFAGLFTAENQLTLASIQGAAAEQVRVAGIMRSTEAAQAQVKGLRETAEAYEKTREQVVGLAVDERALDVEALQTVQNQKTKLEIIGRQMQEFLEGTLEKSKISRPPPMKPSLVFQWPFRV